MGLKNYSLNLFLLLAILFIFVIVLSNEASAGVGVANCGPNYVQYAPYKTVSFNYLVLRPQDFTVGVQGEFAKYYSYTVDNNVIKGTLTLPPNYDVPGTHGSFIVVTEKPPDKQGSAVGVASIKCPIYVQVPYPGKYLIFRFNAKNINTGEQMPVSYYIESKGDQVIYDAKLTVDVEKNGRTYTKYSKIIPSISPSDKISESFNLQTQDLSPGLYYVNAHLDYGNKTLNDTQQIRVGSLDINVDGITSNVTASPYTKLNFTLENNWNNPVKNVYVTYTITSGDMKFNEVQTPSADFGPFEKKTIQSIAETPGIVPGSYFITYRVHFEDNVKKGTAPLFVKSKPSSKASLILALSGVLLTIMMILLFILIKKNSGGRKLKMVENSMKSSAPVQDEEQEGSKRKRAQKKKGSNKSNKKK